jgi:hypothetical protein
MLNNLTNFWNIITGKMIKRVPENSDLIPLGTKDSRYGGSYKPTAISVEDLTIAIGGLQSVSVDGVTIIGDGTLGNPLTAVSSGGDTKYSNVIFIDAINGNDATGAVNIFNKPYKTIYSAVIAAQALSRTSTDRALIYIRRGSYAWNGFLINYCDFYCEPAVIISGGRITDQTIGSAVNVNFLGYAIFNDTDIVVGYASTIKFQFARMINPNKAALLFVTSSGFANIIVEADYIYASTLGTSYLSTVRGTTNVTITIKEKIESPYTHWHFRNSFSGTFILNCPESILIDGNPYGYGNSKQIVYATDVTANAKIIINGDLINKDPIYYGGPGAVVSLWGFGAGYFQLNGNTYANYAIGLYSNITNPLGKATINGNISSTLRPIVSVSVGTVVIKNSNISSTNPIIADAEAIFISNTSVLYLLNCVITSISDANIIKVDSDTAKLQLYNCLAFSNGTLGNCVYGTSVGKLVRMHNFRTNKPLSTNVTDVLSPTGLIVDTNLITPNF